MPQPATSHDTPHDVRPDEGEVDRYLSTEEAAQIAGVHPESIRRWSREGQLEVRRRGRAYEVLETSLLNRIGRARSAPAGGGIYDPRWGPFTRDPFRRD